MNDKNFIEELRQKREEYGVTQRKLAVACGISRTYFNLLKAPRIRKILFSSSFLRCLCVYSEAKKNPAFDLWLPVCFRISNVSFLFSEDHKEYCCADVLATNHRVSIEKCITCKSIEEHQNMAINAMYLLYFANTLRIWR